MLGISDRGKNCHASATLAITAKANAMKKEGKDIIGFGAGEPDFEPPQILKDEVIAAVNRKGTAKYTPAAGLPDLKKTVIEKFKRDNSLAYTEKNISINLGAKHTIFNIMMAILNKGDEVIIAKPYWVSYPEIITLAEGVPVIVGSDKDYIVHADTIAKAITKKTKAIIINSPNNPTGAVIPESELKKIAKLAVKNQVYVISDEIYEKLSYDSKHKSIASFGEDIKAITFTVNSMSKSHAVPGWRLGYVAGPEKEIEVMNNIQSHSTSNPCSIIQYGAISTLNSVDDFLKNAVKEYKARRDYIVKELNLIKGITCPKPGGAFYVFPKIDGWDDMDFAKRLLETKFVAVVPGCEFGAPGYLRISYATSMENIKKGVQRIKEFVQENG